MRWLWHRNFNYYHLQLGTQCIVLDHSNLHWQCGKQRGRAWKIRSCDTAALLYCLCSSCTNNIIQEAYPTTEELQKQAPDKRQALIVAPETKPVILSSIKRCDSQQGDSDNAQRQRAWAIIQLPKPRIKPRIVHHHACDQIVQALCPFFVQYATKSWGGAWGRGYI